MKRSKYLNCRIELVSFGNDSNVLILGDFNMPNINWIEGSGFSADFCDFLGDKNLFQLVTEPTRAHNILDLVITNMEDSISKNGIL